MKRSEMRNLVIGFFVLTKGTLLEMTALFIKAEGEVMRPAKRDASLPHLSSQRTPVIPNGTQWNEKSLHRDYLNGAALNEVKCTHEWVLFKLLLMSSNNPFCKGKKPQ